MNIIFHRLNILERSSKVSSESCTKTLSKTKWSQNLGKWLQGGRTTRIPKPRNPTASQLKPQAPGSKNPTRPTGGSTGPNTKPPTARGPGGKPVRNKPTRTKPSSTSPTTGGGNWFSRNPGKTLALGAGAGIVGMNALTGGGSDKEGEKTGQGTKDDPVILQRNPDGSLTQVTPKKDDVNYIVSSQTGADQRPKSPLDTNPYFDNPGLKSYWNTRAKQVKQKAMDGSRNLRNHVEKKDDEIVIIEYLLNNGHADTVEEAVYVFTQLDENYIASILNENV